MVDFGFRVQHRRMPRSGAALNCILAALLALLTGLFVHRAFADQPADGEEVMRHVNARPRADSSRMKLDMILRAQRGEFRKRLLSERKRLDSGYRTIYWTLAPEHENGIGLLLSEDAAQHGMWMYFPAARQVVHVVTQGLPALASDFSCADLLAEVPLADYEFRVLEREQWDGVPVFRVEMKPRTERLRSELGFANSVGWVRSDMWMIVRADYFDDQGTAFKTFRAEDIALVQGIWTARKLIMKNHRAGHSTEVRVIEVDYALHLVEEAFTLARFGSGLVAPPK